MLQLKTTKKYRKRDIIFRNIISNIDDLTLSTQTNTLGDHNNIMQGIDYIKS